MALIVNKLIEEQMKNRNDTATEESGTIEGGGVNNSFGTIEENENEETINGISLGNYADWATQWQERQWAREDELRKEQQERDDTAYTRMVADMHRAGINPNLQAGTPNYGTDAQATTATDSGMSANATQIGAILSSLTSKYGDDLNAAVSKYKTDMDKAIADQSNATQKQKIATDFFSSILGIFAKALMIGAM